MDFSGRGYRYKCWPPGVMLSPDKLYSGSAGAGALLGRCHVLVIGANDTDAPSFNPPTAAEVSVVTVSEGC